MTRLPRTSPRPIQSHPLSNTIPCHEPLRLYIVLTTHNPHMHSQMQCAHPHPGSVMTPMMTPAQTHHGHPTSHHTHTHYPQPPQPTGDLDLLPYMSSHPS